MKEREEDVIEDCPIYHREVMRKACKNCALYKECWNKRDGLKK